MKKFFRRLLPFTSLICLSLLGSYHPVASWKGLSPDEAQLAELRRNVVYQTGAVTRDYLFTLIFDAPIEGWKDWFGNDDFRFFTQLTNFQCGTLKGTYCTKIGTRIVAITPTGQNFINAIGPGNGNYAQSHTYPGYGRFYFNAGKPRVYRIYGLAPDGKPRDGLDYVNAVQRDLKVVATGVPSPKRKANPAIW